MLRKKRIEEGEMESTFRAVAFWTAAVVSVTFLVAVIIAAGWAYLYVHAHPPAPGQEHMGSLAITYATLLVISGAIFSGVYFGWRRERREARELRQQITDLRLKLSEVEQ
jgi:hypothetical protein